jgi:ABC-type nitrate/sulfonate/bicarbonate transport system permease component
MKFIYLLLSLFILWFIFFEYVFAPNQILPEPSIALLSLISLFNDYHLLVNIVSSFSAIFLPLIVAYFFLWTFRIILINYKKLFGSLTLSVKWISSTFPIILLGLFLIYWFPDSEIIKYVFIFIISLAFLTDEFEKGIKTVNSEFIDSSISLGAGKNFLATKIYWKSVETFMADSLIEIHFYLWSILIVFEFIKGGLGLGAVLSKALLYKDLAAFFTSVLIIGLIIFISTFIIKIFRNKYFYWSIN